MKKLFILLLCIPVFANATNRYWSATGNDAADGSLATPWQTITKFNTFFNSGVAPGDSIFFKRGDTFAGAMAITNSGSSGSHIFIGAYGTGAKPIITGFVAVSAWTSLGGGLYESTSAVTSNTTMNLVTFQDTLQPMGRWPRVDSANAGYRTFQSHSGNTTITSSQISGAASFVGGEVVIRKNDWVLDRGRISAQTGTVVTYQTIGTSGYSPIDDWGFFFQNHSSACTVLGDWAYDSTSRKLRMYFGGASTGSYTVQVTAIDILVTTSTHTQYVDFDNLKFTGANTEAFKINWTDHIQITNCDIDFCGVTGLEIFNDNSNTFLISGCTFQHCNGNAITGGTSTGWTIRSNTFNHNGMIRGASISGAGNYEGISYIGGNSLVEYNIIKNTGFNGVNFRGDSVVVRRNFVDSFNMILQDGAGIYTYFETTKTGRKIDSNIVTNGMGDHYGESSGAGPQTHGIYIDGGARNVEIIGNTVAGCSYGGMELNYPKSLNVQYNTLYNNGSENANSSAGFVIFNDGGSSITGMTIKHNILFARRPEQLVIYNTNTSNDISSWGTIDSNYYCRPISEPSGINGIVGFSGGPPYNDGGTVLAKVGANTRFYSLDAWQTLSGQDSHTLKTYATISDTSKIRFEYNATNSTVGVNLGGYSYKDVAGTSYQGTINLAPYSSIILLNPTAIAPAGGIIIHRKVITQ